MDGRNSVLARTHALILAGGRGKRLHPLTVSRPKPAVSFGGGFRIIDFTLSNCLYSGLGRVSLLTQYRHEELHRYVRDRWSELWDNTALHDRLPLAFLPPANGRKYLGTADAVFQNTEFLESSSAEFVLVLSGDHIYHMDYWALLRQHAGTAADLTIATVEHPLAAASRFGVAEVDESLKVTGFEEKPVKPRSLPSRPSMALVSMGVYVFNRKALLDSLIAFCGAGEGYDLGHDIIPSLVQSGRAYAYDFQDDVQGLPRYWRDIGTLDAYYEASMDLLDPDGRFDPYADDCWSSPLTPQPSSNGDCAAIPFLARGGDACVTRSILSPGTELEDGVRVDDSVLLPGVRIGKGARLRRAIVEEGVRIPAGFRVGFDLDQDRRHHTVTDTGVVVVSKTPDNTKPVVVDFAFRGERARMARTAERPRPQCA